MSWQFQGKTLFSNFKFYNLAIYEVKDFEIYSKFFKFFASMFPPFGFEKKIP